MALGLTTLLKMPSTIRLAFLTLLPFATVATATSTTTANSMPSATDSAPGSQTSNAGNFDNTSLANYYFVFLALIICIAGLGGFLVWRRRRRRFNAMMQGYNSRGAVTMPGLGLHDRTMAAGYFRHRWRSQSEENVGRDEGLNEFGEAPPAYAPPKTRGEQEREAIARDRGVCEPAAPAQTLSREQAGLKPPEYTAAHATPVSIPARRSDVSGEGSSRDPHVET
ncbi:hypothetical protein BAUCODRAFT_134368 [Baudoinia panamericana UAMH 10762]|uniref:Gram-positive cocci surface proteins LPxTG domain-containing protein n=1 Tax=Baudoinia panamericana (strain UAMH 10762) TaxID=717646 RepID=M2LEW9_BAUPA|nr:uncharacterized protein BAUCODRAFT_134368 [Baudoinia panamericana UAMH 10762]EMC92557.1 hypothetical protein BAUCODRAFT_134368 [Baudoinia panamericana UAMH 10762]